jgi:two-component sensor histidine kinase
LSSVSTETSLLSSSRASTFAARRIDIILGRVYSLVLGLSTLEMTLNALKQAPYLQPALFWLTLGSVLASVVGLAISNWFLDGAKIWYTLHLASITVTLVFWQFQVVNPNHLPVDFTPWVWWGLGMASLSAGFGLSIRWSAVFITLIPVWFVFLRLTPDGGSSSFGRALQDAVYTFLISAVFTALVQMLKYRALQQDAANLETQAAAAKTATLDAVQRERIQLSALVQQKIITALEQAATATTPASKKASAKLAQEAIQKLANYTFEEFDYRETVSVASLFNAIEVAVTAQAPSFKIDSEAIGTIQVPAGVSIAITEATMQAVANSIMHAGGPDVNRVLLMKSNDKGLKVVVKDDGVGFWPNRIQKDRLGFRVMIVRNVESVGGHVNLQTAPGEGTSVILKWDTND